MERLLAADDGKVEFLAEELRRAGDNIDKVKHRLEETEAALDGLGWWPRNHRTEGQ